MRRTIASSADLRGMGLSSKPADGYQKKSQAGDIRKVLDRLGIDKAEVVCHDIGTMFAYAYAARFWTGRQSSW